MTERRELDLAERIELEEAGRQTLAKLPPNYQWPKGAGERKTQFV